MTYSPHYLPEQLRAWGKQQVEKPLSNNAIKEKVMAYGVKPEKIEYVAPRRSLFWVAMTVPALIVVLSIGARMHNTQSHVGMHYEGGGGGPDAPLSAGRWVYDDPSANPLGVSQFDEGSNLASSGSGFLREVSSALGLGRATSVVDTRKDYLGDVFDPNPIDTREYFKTEYHATLQTRQVEEQGKKIHNLIRAFDGRVDSISLNPNHGHISFVIPAKALDSFRENIEDLVPFARLLVEQESSENLLVKKQEIERAIVTSEQVIYQAEKDKSDTTASWVQRKTDLTYRIQQTNDRIVALTKEKELYLVTPERQKQVDTELNTLRSSLATTKQQLAQEEQWYMNRMTTLNQSIARERSVIQHSHAENQVLNIQVQTVEGTITLERLRLFDALNLFLPVKKIIIVVCIGIILFYLFFGRRKEFDLP